MPAPVFSRRSFTIPAVIVIVPFPYRPSNSGALRL
jgi:hypothetical protein